VRCVGACGLAPAVVIDGETHGNMTPDQVQAEIEAVVTGRRIPEPIDTPEVMTL